MNRILAAVSLLVFLPLYAAETFSPLVLPVQVHLVRSTVHPRLQTTLGEAEIRAIFDEVNVIWAQAGIRFEIKGIDEIQAMNIAPKKWFEKDRNWVKSAIPTSQFSFSAIDVCFVKAMGPNGFFYGEPVVVCEEPDFTKVRGGSNNPVARVTAHELGHVLALQHRQDHTNLMASARNGFSLNGQEIKDARARAMEIIRDWSSTAAQP